MLRKVKDLIGFTVCCTDRHADRARDLYLSDTDWAIHCVVVDTNPWILGWRVVIPSATLELPHWEARELPVTLTQEQLKDSPSASSVKPISWHQFVWLYGRYRWPAA